MASVPSQQYRLFTAEKTGAAPRLLVAWEPFWPTFFTNLLDAILRRELPPLAVTARPAAFWPDVFVDRPMPWKNFAQSAGLHVLFCLLVFSTGHLWLSRQPTLADPYTHTAITYYAVDELLPSLISPAPKTTVKASRKGEPEFARQEIISVPVGADNSTQTIVNPMHLNLMRQEVELPNLMVWEPVPVAPPVASLRSPITLPTLPFTAVAPAPDISQLQQVRPKLNQSAEAVEPAPSVRDVRGKQSNLTVATSINAVAPAPKLELPLQRSAIHEKRQEVVEPPPAVQNLPAGPPSSGQLIALNVRPKAPAAELKVPDGSRSGVFAATPAGRSGAPGTPELVTNGTDLDTAVPGKSDTKQGSGAAPANGLAVPGITVTGGDARPGSSAVVAKTVPPQPESPRTIASAAAPSFAGMDRLPIPPYTPASERKVEDEVFGSRKYYSMQLNMPNLTSAGGSWIIRFAELKESVDSKNSELSTPVVTTKVDPAYPPDLIQDRVEGTVTLYAVIHANGTVGEVRLLRGLNERLDENARVALMRWHFRPATKNGVPVDLEAVVQIPFKARRVAAF